MKRMTKVLSLLLACMLLFNSMMFGVVSQEALPTETETASNMSAVIDDKYEAGDEIVEWREEGVKHYYLGDGQFQAVIGIEETELQYQAQGRASSTDTYMEETTRLPIDTHISSSAQSTNYGDTDGVRIGNGAIGLFYHSMIKFPHNVNIISSRFYFAYYYNVSTGYLMVRAYAVEEYWDEYTVTWDDMEAYPNMGLSNTACGAVTLGASSTCSANNPKWASLDVTSIVRSWYAGDRHNEGIALKRDSGTNNSVIIKSYESEEEYYSYFTITYSLLDDIVIGSNEYYIKNSEFGKYVQIDNNASINSDGAITEIWDKDGADDQKWEITYLYNGYYKIISSASGKALTAPSSIDSSITQTSYTGANKQQWKITRNTEGLYKISPRSNSSKYMSAGDGLITANGRNVEMRNNQDDARDEWNIVLVYDAAVYRSDTRIFFDSTALDELSISEMLKEYKKATSAFYSEFGIKLNPPTIHHSDFLEVSAECSQATHVNTHCTAECGDPSQCATEHHKSANRLLTDLGSQYYYTTRLVGYNICTYKGGTHKGVNGLGYTYGRNSIVSVHNAGNDALTIQHELTHNIGGMVDGTCSDGQDCVFKGNLNSWCDSCSEAILENIS